MADVQALDMDVVTEESNHQVVGMAVSVCITPAAPAPLPMPYPTIASVSDGISDSPLRTKVAGSNCATIGSVLKACHGNEAGTLKEVVSLNTAGPVAPITGAFTVLIELGPVAFTGSMAVMNKAITPGAGSSGGDAGGAGGGGGGGAGGPGAGGGPGGPDGPGGGGGGGGGSADGANGPPGSSSSPSDEHTCQGGHPVDLVSGAVVDSATDLEVTGLIPLAFKRYYSSFRHGEKDSSLGPGWSHSFEQRIVLRDKCIALRDSQGRFIRFEKVGVGQSSFHRRERMTLARTGEVEFRVYAHDERRTSVFSPVRADGPAVIRRIEDNYGNAIVFEYRQDRLARVVDTAGRVVTVAWRGERLASLSIVAGSSGGAARYEYSREGCLSAVRNVLGHVETYRYDALGRMVATTTLSGAVFAYEYEGDSARCTATFGPDGLYEVHLVRDGEKRTTFVDGEEPRVVHWNDLGLVTRLTLPNGNVLDEVAYDEDGFVIARANGAGEGSQFWYDERGNRIREVDACHQSTTYEYDGDALVRISEPWELVTQFIHDEKGTPTAVRYPSGQTEFRRYDTRGRLVEVTGTVGRITNYEYDEQNNIVAQTDARGARTTFRFDGLGRPVEMRDALGQVTTATFDALGHRTSLRLPDGATTRFAYDPAGRLSQVVDALGRTIRYRYSGFRALSEVIGPAGQSWSLKRSREERVLEIVNPVGESYSFERDEAGRVVRERAFDGREIRYDRDAAGRIARIVYADGTNREFSYDRMGRIVSDIGPEDTITLRRDAFGRVATAIREWQGGRHETVLERDRFGNLVGETQGARRVRYEVDVLGSRTGRVLPNGASTRYTYDACNDLERVAHDGFSLDIGRDVLGRETSRELNATTRIAQRFDPVDRLIAQTVTTPGPNGNVPSVLVDRRWTYDQIGRVERIDDARRGTKRYEYNDWDLLVGVSQGLRREAFSYDAAGSILSALEELVGGRRVDAAHEVGAGNVLLSAGDTTFTYDARGRRVRSIESTPAAPPSTTELVWDSRDALRSAQLPDGTTVRLEYDALGRRIRKEVQAGGASATRTTDYVWDGDVLAMDIDSSGGERVFVHEPGTFLPLLQQERGEVLACLVDHVGTPTELISGDGTVIWSAAHYAWGEATDEYGDVGALGRFARAPKSPFRLLGQIADDELGLCFTRNRLFDPTVGRWITPDPLGLVGGLNVYAFDGSPSVIVDPWGLATTGASGTAHQTGSYQIKFKSGKTYDGKGPASRMETSAKERSGPPNNDPVVSKVWTPAANEREAFKQESRNLDANGGPGNPNNYNAIESPGKKYRQQDGEIP
jgi:RHS repeat-associated protein